MKFKRLLNGKKLLLVLELILIVIYITGSNAYLLSSEISTLLSGRYVEIHVIPLSFAEYNAYYKSIDKSKKFENYIKQGGFPGLLEYGNDMEVCSNYLEGVYNTVVVKDIISRSSIHNTEILKRILIYMIDNIGNLISANKIANYLTSRGNKTTVATVIDYLHAFEKAYILYKVKRFDVKGKRILRSPDKYYISDIGLRSQFYDYGIQDIGRVLENIVYLELFRRGNKISVGSNNKFEVDFIATNNEGTKYYQVSLSAADKLVMERELKGLRQISDQHEKILLTMDYGNLKNGRWNLFIEYSRLAIKRKHLIYKDKVLIYYM